MSTRTDPLLPYTTLVRSARAARHGDGAVRPRGRARTGVRPDPGRPRHRHVQLARRVLPAAAALPRGAAAGVDLHADEDARHARSEEHTSELQSLMRISYAVFCLKKKKP